MFPVSETFFRSPGQEAQLISVVPIHHSCGIDPLSAHIQEATNNCKKVKQQDLTWVWSSWKLHPLAPRPRPVLQLNCRAIPSKIQLRVTESVGECVPQWVCEWARACLSAGHTGAGSLGSPGRAAARAVAQSGTSSCRDLGWETFWGM